MPKSDTMISYPLPGERKRKWIRGGLTEQGNIFLGIIDTHTDRWQKLSAHVVAYIVEELKEMGLKPELIPAQKKILYAPYGGSKKKQKHPSEQQKATEKPKQEENDERYLEW